MRIYKVPANSVVFAIVAALGLLCPIAAQDTTTAASPELRDFRLDPKPAEKPTEPAQVGPPSPEPTPKAAPTPAPVVREAVPAAPQTAATKAPAVAGPSRKAEPEKDKTASKATETQNADAQEAAPKDNDTAAIGENNTTAPSAGEAEPEPLPKPAASAKAEANNGSFSGIAGLPLWVPATGAALLALLIGFGFYRRRRNAPVESFEALQPDEFESDPLAERDMSLSSEPPASAPSMERLEASFSPERAQLGLANLTITGRLSLQNRSEKPLQDLTVRTTMISASDGQRETIRLFHADGDKGHVESIGDIRAGEEIALSLEIQQPRTEMNEFDWRERRFLAPIVLINLSGRGSKGMVNCELSCLIGRETAAEAQRMKPFHTDRGPQRFEGLSLHLV